MNLTIGAPQRKRPKAGDVFAVRFEGVGVVFGRLVDPQPLVSKGGFWKSARLIYVYAGVYETAAMPPAESLIASNLLFSPMLIDKSPWSEGGIEVVGNVPLTDGHVLERYSFRMRRGPNRDVLSYLGPDLKQTPELIEPAIEYVLTNVLTLDLAISAVLGLSEPVAAPALPASIDEAVELVELDEDTIVCVTVQAGNEELLALGGRINERWAQAYMNGYNWEALIHAFVASRDPDLASAVQPDAEADMYSASMSHSPENLDRMRQFEALIREMLADEQALFAFIEGNEIPWD